MREKDLLYLGAIAGGIYLIFSLRKGIGGIGEGAATAVKGAGEAVKTVTTEIGETAKAVLDPFQKIFWMADQGFQALIDYVERQKLAQQPGAQPGVTIYKEIEGELQPTQYATTQDIVDFYTGERPESFADIPVKPGVQPYRDEFGIIRYAK